MTNTTTTLTIGQVARRGGVGVETVRFYEREGLLERPSRRLSGYRQYGEGTVARLRFIRRAKALGFTLKEITELLALRVEPGITPADVKRRAEAKIADIEAKLRTLRRMQKALAKLTAACSGHGHIGDCPILDALEREDAAVADDDDKTQTEQEVSHECRSKGRGIQRGVPRV